MLGESIFKMAMSVNILFPRHWSLRAHFQQIKKVTDSHGHVILELYKFVLYFIAHAKILIEWRKNGRVGTLEWKWSNMEWLYWRFSIGKSFDVDEIWWWWEECSNRSCNLLKIKAGGTHALFLFEFEQMEVTFIIWNFCQGNFLNGPFAFLVASSFLSLFILFMYSGLYPWHEFVCSLFRPSFLQNY